MKDFLLTAAAYLAVGSVIGLLLLCWIAARAAFLLLLCMALTWAFLRLAGVQLSSSEFAHGLMIGGPVLFGCVALWSARNWG